MTPDERIEKALKELRAPMGRYGTIVFNDAEARRVLEGLRASVIRECHAKVLEQRCERGTPWDRAVVACAETVRALATDGARGK